MLPHCPRPRGPADPALAFFALLKALAREAGVAFFSAAASEFVETLVRAHPCISPPHPAMEAERGLARIFSTGY